MPHNRERRNDDQEDPGQTHLNSDAKIAYEGRPQEAPLPIVFSRRYALGRAPTRGAPTNCLLQALCPGEGTHKGRPYQLSSLGVMSWKGHPQGAPLPIVFSRRYALGRAPTRGAPTRFSSPGVMPLGRAPTRGAPTRFRQPHVGLSQFDAIALQEDQSLLHEVQARGRMTSSQQSSGTN